MPDAHPPVMLVTGPLPPDLTSPPLANRFYLYEERPGGALFLVQGTHGASAWAVEPSGAPRVHGLPDFQADVLAIMEGDRSPRHAPQWHWPTGAREHAYRRVAACQAIAPGSEYPAVTVEAQPGPLACQYLGLPRDYRFSMDGQLDTSTPEYAQAGDLAAQEPRTERDLATRVAWLARRFAEAHQQQWAALEVVATMRDATAALGGKGKRDILHEVALLHQELAGVFRDASTIGQHLTRPPLATRAPSQPLLHLGAHLDGLAAAWRPRGQQARLEYERVASLPQTTQQQRDESLAALLMAATSAALAELDALRLLAGRPEGDEEARHA